MYRALFLIIAALLLTTGTAAAGKKKPKAKQPAIACSSEMSCARKCSAKNAAACDRLGKQLDSDLETWRHHPDINAQPDRVAIHTEARANLPAACNAKQVRSCILLGRLEEQGLGGPLDVSTAQERFTKACDAGEGAGCVALGTAYKEGSFGGKVPKLAYAAYDKGCKAGFQDACADAGLMKADGIGTDLDDDGGMNMIAEACVKKSAEACSTLAAIYEYGSVKGSATEIKRLKERACELDDEIMCIALGQNEADPTIQLRYYDTACAFDYQLGCKLAANLIRSTEPDRARGLDERACALGDGFTCDTLAQLYKGDPKNRDKYLAFLEATCDAEQGSYACLTRIMVDLPEVVYDEKTHVGTFKRKPKKGEIEKIVLRLEALCDRLVYACEEAARLLSNELYGKTDRVRARKFAQKVCDTSESCYLVQAIDEEIQFELDVAACAKDDLQACLRWATGSEWRDPKGAAAALAKACTGGVKEACYTQQHQRVWANGDVTDPAAVSQIMVWCREGVLSECKFLSQMGLDESNEASRKGCELGDHESCTASGNAQVATDPAKALIAYERGCSLDPASASCAQIPPLREAKLLADETAGCKANKADSCVALGDRLRYTNPVEALAAYDRACTAKRADACYTAGLLRTNDPTRALQDHEKACELGSLDGCEVAGETWLAAGDQAKAKPALTRACLGGKFEEACVAVAPLWRADPTDKDHVQLFAVLDRGCAFGDAAACEERQYPNGRPAGVVDSGYSSYRPSSGPRRFHLRLDVGAFRISPLGSTSMFEAYNGGAIGVGVRTRRAIGSGMLGVVVEGRGALSYGQQSDLGYDGNGVVGLGIGRGGVAAELAGVIGYDAMGEAPAPATAFGLEATHYYGWELRARASFGARYAAGFSYAKLGRQSDAEDEEKRIEFTLSRRGARGGAIGLGIRSVAYDGGGVTGAFLRIDR